MPSLSMAWLVDACVQVENAYHARVVERMCGILGCEHHDVWMRTQVDGVLFTPHIIRIVIDTHDLVSVQEVVLYVH